MSGHEQKLDKREYCLFERCKSEIHDYCCGMSSIENLGHEDECLEVEIMEFECGCKAYITNDIYKSVVDSL